MPVMIEELQAEIASPAQAPAEPPPVPEGPDERELIAALARELEALARLMAD